MNTARCLFFRLSTSLALCASIAACSSSDSSAPIPAAAQDASSDPTPGDVVSESPAQEASLDAVVEETSALEDVALQDAPFESDGAVCKLVKKYSSSNTACNDCAEQNCCAKINVCFNDLECDDTYVNCILACALMPDDAGDGGMAICLDDCATQAPKGKSEYDTAIGCADDKCKSECQ